MTQRTAGTPRPAAGRQEGTFIPPPLFVTSIRMMQLPLNIGDPMLDFGRPGSLRWSQSWKVWGQRNIALPRAES